MSKKIKGASNKMLKESSKEVQNKKVDKRKYTFPELWCVIEASSMEEALELVGLAKPKK